MNQQIERLKQLNSEVDSKLAHVAANKSKVKAALHEPIGSSKSTSNIENPKKATKQRCEDEIELLRKSLIKQEKLNADLKSSWKKCKDEKKMLENDLIKLKRVLSSKTNSISTDEIEYLRSENNRLHKEVESLKSLVKENENKSTHRELKMKRALEDITQMKSKLSEYNSKAGKGTEESDVLVKKLRENIRELESQKRELIDGFKKQMKLIDVLKKQKEHLETCIKLEILDKDFASALAMEPT